MTKPRIKLGTVQSGSARGNSLRPDIQGLRALAVVAVILDHLAGWPAGGFVGVDVFFVISGFLITGLLLREHQRTGRISFTGFYRRRIKRIMPAATTVVVVTLFAGMFLFGVARQSETFIDGIWAVFFGANWHFASAGTDYFQLGGPISPLQHYWSLSVEEQFYFVWPWLMLFVFWAVSRRSGSTEKNARLAIGATIVSISVASFVWAIFETLTNPTWAYFSTFSRAWELGVGAIIALLAGHLARLPSWSRPILGWFGLVGIIVAIFVVSDVDAFPAPWAALPVLATGLMIAAGTGGEQRFMRPVMNRLTNYVGDISYSLYLWHFPVLIMLLTFMADGQIQYYVASVLLTGVLSVASYHLIEDPIRKSKWLDGTEKGKNGNRLAQQPASRKLALGWIAVLTTVSLLLVIAAVQMPIVPVQTAAVADRLAAYNADPAGETEAVPECLGAASLDANAVCSAVVSSRILPAPDALTEDTGNSDACFPNEDKPMKVCNYGDAESSTRVAIVGDSHAASLLPGLSLQAGPMGWQLDTYVGAGCLWMGSDSCAGMPAIKAALVAGEYDVVITSAYRGSGITDKNALARDVAEAWSPVTASGAKIVVVEDVPGGARDAVACVTRINFDAISNDCAITRDSAYRVKDALAMAVALSPDATLIDTEKYFCHDTNCPAVIGNVIVYRDDISHITASYSKTLGPYLAAEIAAVVP